MLTTITSTLCLLSVYPSLLNSREWEKRCQMLYSSMDILRICRYSCNKGEMSLVVLGKTNNEDSRTLNRTNKPLKSGFSRWIRVHESVQQFPCRRKTASISIRFAIQIGSIPKILSVRSTGRQYYHTDIHIKNQSLNSKTMRQFNEFLYRFNPNCTKQYRRT